MKKYTEYMDNVRASDTLHQRLLGLEAPGKRPVSWKKYGTLAAALVLVCGLGAWGLGKAGGWAALAANFRPDATLTPEIAAAQPDIAAVEPGDVPEPGEKTLGGYEVVSGSGASAISTYYVLPYIEYGDVGGTAVCLDWDIPQGATRRELTGDEMVTLMGGVDAVNTHLDWGEYQLTGWGAWYEDGSFWGAYIKGFLTYGGWANQFEFAVTAGMLPPTCIVYLGSVTQEVRGLTVTADGYDSEAGVDASTRRVSFMKDDYGYRFDLNSTNAEQAELLVSRLVCHVADRGLELSVVGGAIPDFVPDYDPTYEDGVPGYDSSCPYCADGTPHTHPYDPEDGTYVCADCGQTVPAGTKHSHPHIGADATYTCDICGRDFPVGSAHTHPFMGADSVCPDCGAAIPAGTAHVCQTGDGHPLAHTCEICGEVLPIDVEHSHGAETCPDCGESYAAGVEHHCAGGTYTCPDCGQTVSAAEAHSHELCHLPVAPEPTTSSDSHHDSDHHGDSHH